MAMVRGQTSFEKGMEKGELQALRTLLRRQLEGAFGPLSETALTGLESMSSEDLLKLGDKIREAKSLAELGLDQGTNGTAPAGTP